MPETPAEPQALPSGREIAEAAIAAGPGWCGKPEPHGPHQVDEWNACGGVPETPAEPQALSAEEEAAFRFEMSNTVPREGSLLGVAARLLATLDAARAASRESVGAGLDERLEGAKELFLELISGDSGGFIPAEAGIKDKDGKAEDWLPVGFVFAAFEKIKARLAAAHPQDPPEPFVVCGIGGCDFAVERGEGRTMALHQSEDHPR